MGWRLPTLAELIALCNSRKLESKRAASNDAGRKYWNFSHSTWAADLNSNGGGVSFILNDRKIINAGTEAMTAAISCVHENGDL
jgi:hypothetical protein